MAAAARLVTFVDLDDDGADPSRMSCSARHEAVLTDGSRVLLLDDRGWAGSMGRGSGLDIWSTTSVADVELMARMVVGPDEPPAGRSHEAEAAGHWAALAGVLRHHGVAADPRELSRLPHDVVLSDRLRAKLG